MRTERRTVIVLRSEAQPIGHGGHRAGQNAFFIQSHLLKAVFPAASIGRHDPLGEVKVLRVDDGRVLVDRIVLRRLIDILDRLVIQEVRRHSLLRFDVATAALTFQHIHDAAAVPVETALFDSAVHIPMCMLLSTQHNQHFGDGICGNARHIHHENQLDASGFFLVDGDLIHANTVIPICIWYDKVALFIPLALCSRNRLAPLMGLLLGEQRQNLECKVHILIQREHIFRLEQDAHRLGQAAQHIDDAHTVHQVAGQAAQVLHHDDVEFALLRILQHLHKTHSLFNSGRGNTLVCVHSDHLPLRAAAHIVQIIPLLRRKRRSLRKAVRTDTAIHDDLFTGTNIERIDLRHGRNCPYLAHIPFPIHTRKDIRLCFGASIRFCFRHTKAAESFAQPSRPFKSISAHGLVLRLASPAPTQRRGHAAYFLAA